MDYLLTVSHHEQVAEWLSNVSLLRIEDFNQHIIQIIAGVPEMGQKPGNGALKGAKLLLVRTFSLPIHKNQETELTQEALRGSNSNQVLYSLLTMRQFIDFGYCCNQLMTQGMCREGRRICCTLL